MSAMHVRPLFLLIHLDHYTNWSPQPDLTPSSEVSGLPSLSSDASSRPFPVYMKFEWVSGVIDG
jgi:hypothetical protein